VLVAGCWNSGEVPTKSSTTAAESGSATNGGTATAPSDARPDAFVVGRTKCDDDPRASGCNPPPPREPETPPRRGRVISIVSTSPETVVFVVHTSPGDLIEPGWRGVFLDEKTTNEIPNSGFVILERGEQRVRCEIRGSNGKLPSGLVRLDPKLL
jgi:hypothetical protein